MDPHNLFPEMNLRPDPSLDTPRTAKPNQGTNKVLRNQIVVYNNPSRLGKLSPSLLLN